MGGYKYKAPSRYGSNSISNKITVYFAMSQPPNLTFDPLKPFAGPYWAYTLQLGPWKAGAHDILCDTDVTRLPEDTTVCL
jgi:hypothetical protein